MSEIGEDKVFGFIVLSAALGLGSGLVAFHFVPDPSLAFGVGLVAGVLLLLATVSIAKLLLISDTRRRG